MPAKTLSETIKAHNLSGNTEEPELDKKKQISVIQSQLTKELYFTDYKS